ncbi:MAG: alcohol dehydrogenase catalytic domain-containing protein [candidate division WOR-3 bacterium]
MKRAILYSSGDIRVVEEEIPEMGEDDILVKVLKCGICTGELMDWYVNSKAPYTPGHEIVGVVYDVGKNVKGFNKGERVVVHHHAPCMVCDFCIKGDYVHCETWRKSRVFPGGFSEFIRVPKEIHNVDVLKVPQHISDEDAALVEPLATSVKAVKRGNIKPGERVLGIGLGFMGILNLLVSKVFGAEVFGVDILPERINMAKGFLENVGDYTNIKGFKFDVIIVAPGLISAIESAFEFVKSGGRVILFAPTKPGEVLPLDVNKIYFDEITIIPSYSAGPDDMRLALEILDRVKPSRLITHRIKLQNIAEGFKIAKTPEALKVMVDL